MTVHRLSYGPIGLDEAQRQARSAFPGCRILSAVYTAKGIIITIGVLT